LIIVRTKKKISRTWVRNAILKSHRHMKSRDQKKLVLRQLCWTHPFIHPFIHLFIHSCISSSIILPSNQPTSHSTSCPFNYIEMNEFNILFTQPLIYPEIYWFIYSLTHLFINSFTSLSTLFVHLLVQITIHITDIH
jgi:hypothetical protein